MLNALCIAQLLSLGKPPQKVLLIMKFTAIFLLAACLTVSAGGYSQKVTLHEKNVSLQKVFREINRQTGFQFFYKDDLLNKAGRLNINVTDAPLEQVLELCFKSLPINYRIVDKTIVVTERVVNDKDEVITASTIIVRGRVVNERGEGVVATVQVKGTQNGTTSNEDGFFELPNVDENATLLITGVSIESMEVKVGKRTQINIVIKHKIVAQEEVVINGGYYKTTTRTKTGNIARATSKDFENVPVTSPLLALQGKLPGVEIFQNSAVPGSAAEIKIRGTNSVRTPAVSGTNGNLPLYVIDGIPINSSPFTTGNFTSIRGAGFDPLATIDPANIESVEVLKDADATAIFGSRGANGVILITTKNPRKTSGLEASVNFYQGFSSVANEMELLNTQQFLSMRREAYRNANQPLPVPANAPEIFFWDTTRSTNWQKKLLGDKSKTTNASAQLSVGSERTQFGITGSFNRETMLYPGDFGYKRYALQSTFRHVSHDRRLNVTFVNNYGVNDIDIFDDQNIMSNGLWLAPNAPNQFYTADGKLNWEVNPLTNRGTWINPLAGLKTIHEIDSRSLVSNLSVGYNVTKKIKVESVLGLNRADQTETITKPIASINPYGFDAKEGTRQHRTQERSSWIIEPRAVYNNKIKKHDFEITLGASLQEAKTSQVSLRGLGYRSDATLGSFSGAQRITNASSNGEYVYASVYTRIAYQFARKLFLSVTGRRDGSSRFGPDSRYGNFGSVGAGWIFREKSGAKSILSFGKIRGSYGVTGSDNIGDQQYVKTYSTDVPYLGTSTISPSNLYNSDYAWETIRKSEVALETEWFNNRLSVDVAYYSNRTKDQLFNYVMPATTGFESVLMNFDAIVKNSGWEIMLRSVNLARKKFTWTSSFNISFNRNKLVSYPGLETSSYSTNFMVGKSLSIARSFIYEGVDPATGLYTFKDVDNNGVINYEDQTFTKALETKYFGGMQNEFRYNGFSLILFFNFSDRIAKTDYFPAPGASRLNQPVTVLDRWQKPGDITNVQKFSVASDANLAYSYWRQSDAVFENIRMLRLRTLSFGYTLPEKLIKNAKIRTAKLFFQGQNLFTWTNNKKVWDPETIFGVPPLRTLSFGFQLGF